MALQNSEKDSVGEIIVVYDGLFRDLNRALVTKQDIRCFKQEVNGRIRWIVEIDDPHEASKFESKILGFLERLRRKQHAGPKETV